MEGDDSIAAVTVVEEWSGSSSSKLSKTAVITSNSSQITSMQRYPLSPSLMRAANWRSVYRLTPLQFPRSLPAIGFRTWKSMEVSLTRFGEGFSMRLYRRQVDFTSPVQGFPSSVTPDYVPFQVWDSLQVMLNASLKVLWDDALLSAIGVGQKSATVIGATFQGSNLDSNAKMWRLVADFMNDLEPKISDFRNVDGSGFSIVSLSFCCDNLLGQSVKISYINSFKWNLKWLSYSIASLGSHSALANVVKFIQISTLIASAECDPRDVML
ncbi:hypothetical protein ACLOJK_002476 [Asimina triloba]